jgi:SAM-dependent methyltransferase
VSATTFSPLVVWHDVECGGYRADLPLWRGLAAATVGPVLDVGAGTGRVALDLARAGHDVTALDREAELLDELNRRAAGLLVETVVADAADFSLPRRFGLVIVPMQTIQLLPERARFLACARAHLLPGGLLAAAITGALEDFGDLEDELLPDPDVGAAAGWRFESQPTADRARRRRHRGGRRDRAGASHGRAARARGPRRRVRCRAGAPDRRDGGARRRRGGAAACLSGRCACARSIRT